MKPCYVLSDAERDQLATVLRSVAKNPYEDHEVFSRAVGDLVARGEVPAFFVGVCARVREDRSTGASEAHVLRNCPLDPEIPVLDLDDPVADKHAKKKTFIGEAFLELFAQLVGTPLLSYATRFNGDFFTDVIAINRYSGMQTGFSDSELVYHNDRTAHRVRADFISLLGMRCPEGEFIYTGFVDGRDLLDHLGDEEQNQLRQAQFVTPFDVLSRDNNGDLTVSEVHPILENHHSFRYLDTCTTVAPGAREAAKDALLALKNALVRADKTRHRIQTGDLFVFANQDGLHSRDKMEINDPARARQRWLLKTYAFRDGAAAGRHDGEWLDGVRGRVGD
ncbi:TauD/TfdA family dioxygenase [Streptomyces tsukubensis]|uniref:Taurine catabolism dioxygenase TauD n=1 Tax=Streptomyces tsukubensis TaxID=83656 RepID=A0A1V4A4B8_9ACTN|nr:TauD/TfdA family dioxygenase [Streptomyces tsukubensis]OON75412.1 taurine catabolism dioxygenase TauD [Streptomyces tsukubensis]QFR94978.1 taurine catabolism dioxygenase TauD [Streptomyces tsukubensis]